MRLSVQLVFALLLVLMASSARAERIFESASIGTPGQDGMLGGTTVSNTQFIGVKFQYTGDVPVTTGSVGGHFFGNVFASGTIFAAIVDLGFTNNFPPGFNIATPGTALGSTLIPLPAGFPSSNDYAANVAVTLEPDHFYALIFGSGLFGATNPGAGAPGGDTDIGAPEYFVIDGPTATFKPVTLSGVRLFLDTDAIASVPEPSSLAIALFAAASLGVIGWRKRRAISQNVG